MDRSQEALKQFKKLYQGSGINELAHSAEGFRFLLLRSLERKEYLEQIAAQLNVPKQSSIKRLAELIFASSISREELEKIIRELDARDRAVRKQSEKTLLAELYKVRVFDWGGIHENDINKYLVDTYIKKVTSYDDLVRRIEHEILESLKGFVLCSWYNNWTSIIIEDIFKSHPRVLPTVGKIKQVDFFIDSIPFDLKMTYFPVGFMEEQRQKLGVVKSEVAELKKACKRFGIPVDVSRAKNDLLLDMIAALSESSNAEVQEFYQAFVDRRKQIISETIANPRSLLKWLYERQGIQRFDTSNRLFLIAIDRAAMEESWKLKRDYPLLKDKIESYLSTSTLDREQLLLDWEVDGKQFQSYADVLFVLK